MGDKVWQIYFFERLSKGKKLTEWQHRVITTIVSTNLDGFIQQITDDLLNSPKLPLVKLSGYTIALILNQVKIQKSFSCREF